MALKDLTGMRFGKLVVINYNEYDKKAKSPNWLCKCDCGGNKVVSGNSLKRGLTKSCGCITKERMKSAFLVHGMSESKEYEVWRNLKARKNKMNYVDELTEDYICEEWDKSFENFYSDMGKCPPQYKYINRIDHTKGFTKENCVWGNNSNNSVKHIGYGNSKYKGVWYDNSQNNYYVSITKNYKRIYIGRFKDEIEAALEYNKKAIEIHGEFARLNIID